MEKMCPRCYSVFDCKNDRIEECACKSVVLSDEVYRHIKETYHDCLCKECLTHIKVERQRSPKPSAVPNLK